ncbi:MAG: hypothetical protein ACTHN0_14240 [Aquihabitans sp.]
MGMSEKAADKMKALAQGHVDEPVISAGIFLRKGETASRNLTGFARGASFSKLAESMERAPDFPSQTLLAVTDTQLHAFVAKGGFSWKVKEPLATWRWGTFLAEREDGKICTFLHLAFGEHALAELETQSSGAQAFQAGVVDDIVARANQAIPQTA